MFADYIKNKWNTFAQISVWILTIASTFLITPPLLNISDTNNIEPLTRFIIACIVALIFIPVMTRSKKGNYKLWYRIAIFSFIFCLASVLFYFIYANIWSVKYYNDKRLVIGKTISKEALDDKREMAKKFGLPDITFEKFVKGRLGNTELIWPIDELRQRAFILSTLYIFSVTWIAMFIISIIQSIYCYEQKD